MGDTGSKPEGDKSQLDSLKKIHTNMRKIKLTEENNKTTLNTAITSIDELVKNIEESKPEESKLEKENKESKPEESKQEETKPDESTTKEPKPEEPKPDESTTKEPTSVKVDPKDSTTLRGGKRKHRTRRRSKQRDKSTRSLRLI